jgi:hypothetical protein
MKAASTTVDRGLIRSVVERHARRHATSYEDAHKALLKTQRHPDRAQQPPTEPAKLGRTTTVRDREHGGTREIQDPPPLEGQPTPKGVAHKLFQECDRVDALPPGPGRNARMDALGQRVCRFETETPFEELQAACAGAMVDSH